MESALDKAKAVVGGNTALAKRLKERGHRVTPQAVSQWDRVPVERARDVAEITGAPLHELRPDIWPPGENGEKRAEMSNADEAA